MDASTAIAIIGAFAAPVVGLLTLMVNKKFDLKLVEKDYEIKSLSGRLDNCEARHKANDVARAAALAAPVKSA